MDKTEILLSTTAESDSILVQMGGSAPGLMSLLTHGVVAFAGRLEMPPLEVLDAIKGAILYAEMMGALDEEEEE